MGLFRRALFTSGRAEWPYDANTRDRRAETYDETRPVPVFVTVQTLLSFTGAAIVIAAVWWLFDAAFEIDSYAVPIIAGFVLGALLYVLALESSRPRDFGQWISGAVIAGINALFLGMAVLGIDVGLAEAGIFDSVRD